MTGRPLPDGFGEALALILFSPDVHHSCLSVELELLEVVEVLMEGVPDVRSRAFLSLRWPTLSPTCQVRSAANMIDYSKGDRVMGQSPN